MGIFGWSYPPGCSGTPWDDCDYDETKCLCCGADLPDDVEPDTPQDEGYCSERCQQEDK